MDYSERDFLLYHAYTSSEARFFTMKDIRKNCEKAVQRSQVSIC